MADNADTNSPRSGSGRTGQPRSGATHEEMLESRLPTQEAKQPDPMLQLSVGRLGTGSIVLVAVIAAVILGVVFYALNGPA
jgi:hypothetical protein